MAKYESIVKIRGTIDGLTFRDTKEGKIVSAKTGPTREQVLEKEEFANTRLLAQEFKKVTKDATLLRRALGHSLDGVRCTSLNGRVNGLLHRLVKQDKTHVFGQRCALAGYMGQLGGFEFNKDLSFMAALAAPCAHRLDAATGGMQVQFAPFTAYRKKDFPREATHFQLVHGCAALNFTAGKYRRALQYSELLPLSRKTPGPIGLACSLGVEPGEVLVQVVGIQFFRLVHGEAVLVKGGAVQLLEACEAVTRVKEEPAQPVVKEEQEKAAPLQEVAISTQAFIHEDIGLEYEDADELIETLLPELVLCE